MWRNRKDNKDRKDKQPSNSKANFVPSSDYAKRKRMEENASNEAPAGGIPRPIPGLRVVENPPTRNDHFAAGATAHHIHSQTDDSDPASPHGIPRP